MKYVVVGALLVVALYNLLFFQTQLGIGTGLFFLAINLFFFSTRTAKKSTLNQAVFSSLVAIFFAFLVGWRASGIIQALDLAMAAFLTLLALYFYKCSDQLSITIKRIFWAPLEVAQGAASGLARLLDVSPLHQGLIPKHINTSLIRGIVITIPIIGILFLLFVHADPVFARLAEITLQNVGERTVWSIGLFFGLIIFGLVALPKATKDQTSAVNNLTDKGYELAIISGTVTILFAIFIAIQVRYLFFGSGERELAELGIASLTYSEYVRRGFFELLVASAIACSVILFTLRYLHHFASKTRRAFQLISGVLICEVGLILFSAARRLDLYQLAHGLTRARIFGLVFLVWLGVILVILFVRAIREISEKSQVAAFTTVTLGAIFLINILNIDGLIATQYRPTVNGEVDYYYISGLSADAYEGWDQAIESIDQLVNRLGSQKELSMDDARQLTWARLTAAHLTDHLAYLGDKYDSRLKLAARYGKVVPQAVSRRRSGISYNVSEHAAYEHVIERDSLYKKLPTLIQALEEIKNRLHPEVRERSNFDRDLNPPLFRGNKNPR